MNILVVNWRGIRSPQAGGAEVHVHEIFRRLAAWGHSVTLLCSRPPGFSAEETVDGIRTLRYGNWMNFNMAAAVYYLRHLRREPFDVIVDDINKIPFYTPLYARHPVLVLVPHLFGTTVFAEAAFPLAAYVYLWERAVPLVYRRTPAVAISESTKHDLVKRGLDPGHINVVYCGVDRAVYRPPHDGERLPVFAYVGRLKRYKSLDVLLAAAALLRPSHPGVRVVIAGAGDDLSRLRRRARSLGVEDMVSFPGFVPPEQKVALMQTAMALVVPSPKEGWGLTAMEAHACGTPVLASKSPGLVESVRHDVSGLHVPYGDARALAAAMARLIDEPALASRLSQGALEWSARFDWDATAQEMLQQLERAAGGSQ
ncbi:glycosyltransferase family 4 protein [Candidatus Fermentibacteria bacterium]|nr:glycosyltransferase family 4 protein [Candidatus Fermentibacteria bacterium]